MLRMTPRKGVYTLGVFIVILVTARILSGGQAQRQKVPQTAPVSNTAASMRSTDSGDSFLTGSLRRTQASARRIEAPGTAVVPPTESANGLVALGQSATENPEVGPVNRGGGQAAVEKSVVGLRFPVSDSVIKSCQGINCDRMWKVLDEFAKEDRDPKWAVQMESELRDEVSHDSIPISVRSIQCRTTICAAELTSVAGPYLGVRIGVPLDDRVMTWDALTGYETDSNGQRLTVTLMAWRRM
jgi:hypothetical protein